MSGKPQVEIYTDGSCSGNPGPGGYAAILKSGDRRREIAGGFQHTTNGRMELMAVVCALEALKRPCDVDLHSDAKYVVEAMVQRWPHAWRDNGWRRIRKGKPISGTPPQNRDLWERILARSEDYDVRFSWVEGHKGNPDNERANELAQWWTKQSDLPVDEGYVTYGSFKATTVTQSSPGTEESNVRDMVKKLLKERDLDKEKVVYNAHPEWLMSPLSRAKLEIDVYIPDLRFAIEIDGLQHLTNEKQAVRDARKDEVLKVWDVDLVRIHTADVRERPDEVMNCLGIHLDKAIADRPARKRLHSPVSPYGIERMNQYIRAINEADGYGPKRRRRKS